MKEILQLKAVVIVAGGSGTRMQSNIPKQFLLLRDLPVLMHTINVFYDYDNQIDIVLVLPKSQFDYWNKLCEKHSFLIKHTLVEGGKERFFSVKNGLDKILNQFGLIAIHDGVRPLIDVEMIRRGEKIAQQNKSAIPVVPVSSSVRIIDNDKSRHFDRNKIKIVQTPQIFEISLIKRVYSLDYKSIFTDDASVVEDKGYSVSLYNGNIENIKITNKFDLKFAEFLLSNKQEF